MFNCCRQPPVLAALVQHAARVRGTLCETQLECSEPKANSLRRKLEEAINCALSQQLNEHRRKWYSSLVFTYLLVHFCTELALFRLLWVASDGNIYGYLTETRSTHWPFRPLRTLKHFTSALMTHIPRFRDSAGISGEESPDQHLIEQRRGIDFGLGFRFCCTSIFQFRYRVFGELYGFVNGGADYCFVAGSVHRFRYTRDIRSASSANSRKTELKKATSNKQQ